MDCICSRSQTNYYPSRPLTKRKTQMVIMSLLSKRDLEVSIFLPYITKWFFMLMNSLDKDGSYIQESRYRARNGNWSERWFLGWISRLVRTRWSSHCSDYSTDIWCKGNVLWFQLGTSTSLSASFKKVNLDNWLISTLLLLRLVLIWLWWLLFVSASMRLRMIRRIKLRGRAKIWTRSRYTRLL